MISWKKFTPKFNASKEIRDLQDFAKLYSVVIVPEIDSPGHSLAFTTYRPELAQKETKSSSPIIGVAGTDSCADNCAPNDEPNTKEEN